MKNAGFIIVGVLIAAGLVFGGYVLLNQDSPSTTVEILPPNPTTTDVPTETPSPIEVYVVGAVNEPESRLSLPPGSRVEDAIEGAGGALESANLSAVNLAQVLQDGDMIFVPSLGEEVPGETVGEPTEIITPTPNAPRIVNINTATAEELETLPGIGETRANDIIAYREANGPFATVEDLLNVSGIGEGTLENLQEFITVSD
ncbi:MAG: helix-hairpin-helix domain-containing protein [Chloroflexi bacterium]|nr:helix-hairpin-helix domain-containing protein [Chloroflexota bacterium]